MRMEPLRKYFHDKRYGEARGFPRRVRIIVIIYGCWLQHRVLWIHDRTCRNTMAMHVAAESFSEFGSQPYIFQCKASWSSHLSLHRNTDYVIQLVKKWSVTYC